MERSRYTRKAIVRRTRKKRDRSETDDGLEIDEDSFRPLAKGEISPPSYQLMSINNPGGLDLNFFGSSKFQFVHQALVDLASDHFDGVPEKHVLRRYLHEPWQIAKDTPKSDRYELLLSDLLSSKIVCRLEDVMESANSLGVTDLVVM